MPVRKKVKRVQFTSSGCQRTNKACEYNFQKTSFPNIDYLIFNWLLFTKFSKVNNLDCKRGVEISVKEKY